MAGVLLEPCLPSGYDDEFEEPVNDGLQCGICQLPMKDPMITLCGHLFCRGCIEGHLRRIEVEGQNGFCPVDRKAIDREKDVFPNKEKERKILSLAVRCDSKDCEWTNELRLKELHLGVCPFKVISCPDCKVTVARKDLDAHGAKQCPWRIVQCDFCQEQYPDCQMEGHHKSCGRYPMHCEKCKAIVSRQMLQDHLENYCRKSNLPCYFAELGCKKMVPRENMDDHHLKSHKEHLHFLVDEIRKSREKEDLLQNQIATLQEQGKANRKDNEAEIQQMKRQMDEKEHVLKSQRDKMEKWFKYTWIVFFITIFIIFGIIYLYRADLKRQMDDKEQAWKRQMDGKEEALKRQMDGKEEALKRQMDAKEQALKRQMDGKEEALKRQMDGKEQALKRQMDGKEQALKRQMDGKEQALQAQLTNLYYIIGTVAILIISKFIFRSR